MPAIVDKLAISLCVTRWAHDRAVLDPGSMLITGMIQRRKYLVREHSGLLEYGLDQVTAGILENRQT